MRKLLLYLITHPLITKSGILLVGTNIINVLQFLFILFLSRNLHPAEFGVYTAIISLITIPMYEAGAVVPLIVKFAAGYFAKNDTASVRGLFFKVSKASLIVGVILFASSVLFSQYIDSFFKINDPVLITLAGICILIIFVSLINAPLLQAKLEFRFIAFINLTAAVIKLLAGIVLINLGFGIRGAIIAVMISFLVPYLLSFIPLRFLLDRKIKNSPLPTKELIRYGVPSALVLLGITSFVTADLLLVKHFFSPDEAGIYSGVSLVGRVIFFLSAPIGMVMFPLIVQQKEKGENFLRTFQIACAFILLPSIFITSIYFLFPDFVIVFFLKKQEYLAGSPILGLFGVFVAVYSLIYLIANFFLSIGKTKIFIPVLIFATAQIVLISLFHANLITVVTISLLVSLVLLFVLCIEVIKVYGKK